MRLASCLDVLLGACALILSACAERTSVAPYAHATTAHSTIPSPAEPPATTLKIAPTTPLPPATAPTPENRVQGTKTTQVIHTQPVATDANPQAASVAEALRTHRYPERLSPMIKPKPFDAVAYSQNKNPYLSVTEPGRVYDTKQPAPDVPILFPASATTASVDPEGTVRLAVHAIPGSPVSWLSTDLGSFDNQLVSMTVEAGADGIAVAHFTATPGVAGRVNLLAGSPTSSGQVRFVIEVNASPLTPVTSPGAPTTSATTGPQ